ncbi:hypothetical protein ACT7C5_29255 [Bacillus pacificus]
MIAETPQQAHAMLIKVMEKMSERGKVQGKSAALRILFIQKKEIGILSLTMKVRY